MLTQLSQRRTVVGAFPSLKSEVSRILTIDRRMVPVAEPQARFAVKSLGLNGAR
jgi:hypothetical protein